MRQLLTILLLLFAFQSMAQGNLQFNRIVNFKSGNNYTVPAGKVLKLVSINALTDISVQLPLSSCNPTGAEMVRCGWGGMDFCTNYFTECVYNGFSFLKISNQKFDIGSQTNRSLPQNQCSSCPPFSSVSVASSTFNNFKLPIWLGSGEEVSVAQIEGLLISAIEFNIVP